MLHVSAVKVQHLLLLDLRILNLVTNEMKTSNDDNFEAAAADDDDDDNDP
jgi:hypothetical protein